MKYSNIFLIAAATLVLAACSKNTDPQIDSTVDETILTSWKDQTVQIMLEKVEISDDEYKLCVQKLVLKSGEEDNCNNVSTSDSVDTARLLASCGQDQECVCTELNKKVSWEIPDQPVLSDNDIKPDFIINIYGTAYNPFNSGCKLDSRESGNGIVKCQVEKNKTIDVGYGVIIDGCDEYDPRIVVRRQSGFN